LCHALGACSAVVAEVVLPPIGNFTRLLWPVIDDAAPRWHAAS
jgi:hypothetical protein